MIVIVQRAFFVREKTSNLADDALIRRDMEINERFHQLLAVLAFGDLKRKQRIHIQEAEIEPVGTNCAEVWAGNVSIGGDWITVRGKRQTERDAKRGQNFLAAYATAAVTGIGAIIAAAANRCTTAEPKQSLGGTKNNTIKLRRD